MFTAQGEKKRNPEKTAHLNMIFSSLQATRFHDMWKYSEGGSRQNKLHLKSRTPSWARLWALSYMPSIEESDIPTGKPDPPEGRAPQLIPRLSIA